MIIDKDFVNKHYDRIEKSFIYYGKESIDLQHNIFDNVEDIEIIILYNVRKIEETIFDYVPNLKRLEFISSSIDVDEYLFEYLPNLEILRIDSMSIDMFNQYKILRYCRSLKYIHIKICYPDYAFRNIRDDAKIILEID